MDHSPMRQAFYPTRRTGAQAQPYSRRTPLSRRPPRRRLMTMTATTPGRPHPAARRGELRRAPPRRLVTIAAVVTCGDRHGGRLRVSPVTTGSAGSANPPSQGLIRPRRRSFRRRDGCMDAQNSRSRSDGGAGCRARGRARARFPLPFRRARQLPHRRPHSRRPGASNAARS